MSFAKKSGNNSEDNPLNVRQSEDQRTESDVHRVETTGADEQRVESMPKDKCSSSLTKNGNNGESVEHSDQIEVKPILKRKSLDETELKTLPSILKKRDSFDLPSKHTILKRHSLGSESDDRNPSLLLTATQVIDISSKPSSSSKPFSPIHSILKHKSFDEKLIQSRDDYNLPKPILKKTLSIEEEIEKCLNLNNGTNGANASNASSSQSTNNNNSNLHSLDSNRTRSILKTGLEHPKRVVVTKTVGVKSILKTGYKNDTKPVKSALKKSDQTIDSKSEMKSILKSESIGSNEMINTSDTNSSSSDEGVDNESNVSNVNERNGSNDNETNNNSNSVPDTDHCLKETNDKKSNERFLFSNKKLDHKRPNSCIAMSTTKPIAIENETPVPNKRESIGGSISQRLAALKQNGEEGWKKRVSKCEEPEVTLRVDKNINRNRGKSITDRLTLLEDSSIKWKNRVEEKDVKQFTIEGKISEKDIPLIKTPDVQRKTPKALPFRSEKTAEMLKSIKPDLNMPSKPIVTESESQKQTSSSQKSVVVSIPKADDDDFNSFFAIKTDGNVDKSEEISEEALNEIRTDTSLLLSHKKFIRTQSRRIATSNPVRRLAARPDFTVESYTESVCTQNGKSNDSLNPKKSKDLSKSSSFAASALAGLASREDIKAVAGKLRSSCNAPRDVWKSYDIPNSMQTLMLVQVKGRRRAQTRLVEPKLNSINTGDCYILVNRDNIFVWIGQFANVIERTKTLEIANQIQEKKDLCFRSSDSLVLIDYQKSESINKKNNELFLKQLNANTNDSINPTKSPEEDEIYEETIIGTNLIYRVNDEQLVPYEEYWGRAPRYEMLDSEETFVFDFGSEMYVWIGNRTSNIKRKCALDSAKDLWNKGYNYSECDVNPFGMNAKNRDDKRPEWSWFMKVSQNMETILFKDKFLNWPSIPNTIIKSKSPEKQISKYVSEYNFSPIDGQKLNESLPPEPDMILETAHLGRGVRWDDELEGRHISITTLDVKCWQISEYEKHELLDTNKFYFYSGDTYVIRWHYRLSRIGRQLKTGNISRHSMIGRDRSCYFFWLGISTSSTEKGALALMTVELDKEKAQQVRVTERKEEPCFLNIFGGGLVVLRGKRGQKLEPNTWKMFYLRGVLPNEASLVEVECSVKSLRSRTAFVFINSSGPLIYVWNGSKCLKETREVLSTAIDNLIKYKSSEMGLKSDVNYSIKELTEGKEEKEFWNIFGNDVQKECRTLYYPLIDSQSSYCFTPRLFNFSSSSGEFNSKEILCSYRSSSKVCPYPFTQEDIYSAQQPTFFLFDNQNQIFLWESKFAFSKEPTNESEVNTTTGSLNIRWNAERKCALESTLNYCYAKNPSDPPNAYVVCAGLEPDSFCALFPEWKYREDVSLLHIQEGRKAGEMTSVEDLLAQLRKTGSVKYSLEELRKKPIPEGLNPLCLESYLEEEEFEKALGMSSQQFYCLPPWKQTGLRQKAELF